MRTKIPGWKRKTKTKKKIPSLTLSHGTSGGLVLHMQHVFWVTHCSMQSHCALIKLRIIPDKPFIFSSAAGGRPMSVHKGKWVHIVSLRVKLKKMGYLQREHHQTPRHQTEDIMHSSPLLLILLFSPPRCIPFIFCRLQETRKLQHAVCDCEIMIIRVRVRVRSNYLVMTLKVFWAAAELQPIKQLFYVFIFVVEWKDASIYKT